MTIEGVSTLYFNTQSAHDITRLRDTLTNLQNETSSGHIASDLAGYGAASAQILSTQGLIAQTNAQHAAATQLSGQLTAVDGALGQAYNASETLRLAVLQAVGNGDGATLGANLQAAFSEASSALNTQYLGQSLFAGQKSNVSPISVTSLGALAAAPTIASIFQQSTSPQTANLGDGAFAVAPLASTVSTSLFSAMASLQQLITAAGGALPSTLTQAQTTALQTIASTLATSSQTLTTAQGENGILANQVQTKATALTAQTNALTSILGAATDADLAQVATQLAATQTQYQATAQTFATLSRLSLLTYLSATPTP